MRSPSDTFQSDSGWQLAKIIEKIKSFTCESHTTYSVGILHNPGQLFTSTCDAVSCAVALLNSNPLLMHMVVITGSSVYTSSVQCIFQ